MLKVNKKVEYALMALKFIATKCAGQLTSAREICVTFKTPFDTTAKVLQSMHNHGLLHSTKGIKGGYSLARPLSQVTYLEFVQVIEGKEVDNFCHTNHGVCDLFHTCNISEPIAQLNHKLNQFLSQLTLEELLIKARSGDVFEERIQGPIDLKTLMTATDGI